METREITVYEFDELNERAKERAREWFREASSSDEWWDSVYEDAEQCGKLLGIDIKARKKNNPKSPNVPCIWFSGFYSQGDGASFEGYYSHSPDAASKITSHAPNDSELASIAATLDELQAKHGNQITASISQSGRYCHAMSMGVDVSIDGDDADSETEEAIKEAMRDFARWIYTSLRKEYEWINSDETVDENIRANEYKFLESGRIA